MFRFFLTERCRVFFSLFTEKGGLCEVWNFCLFQKTSLSLAYPFLLVYLSQILYQESWYYSVHVMSGEVRDEDAQHLAGNLEVKTLSQCSISWVLLPSRSSLQTAMLFISWNFVVLMGHVWERLTLEYAHLVRGIRQGWNEHVSRDCAILHTHEGPH